MIILNVCHCANYFKQDISGLQDHEFQTRFPDAPALLYQVRLGDEKLEVCSPDSPKKNSGAGIHLLLLCIVSISISVPDLLFSCGSILSLPLLLLYVRHPWASSTRPHLASLARRWHPCSTVPRVTQRILMMNTICWPHRANRTRFQTLYSTSTHFLRWIFRDQQCGHFWHWHFLYQSSKSAAERKATSRPGGGLEGEISGQGGVGELSELPRSCGSSGATGGTKGEMEFGPAQGEGLMGAGAEVEESLSSHFSRKTAIMSQFESKALGLDKAILHSIDCCGKWGHRMEGSDSVGTACVQTPHNIKTFLYHLQVNKTEVLDFNSVLFCFLTASDETKRKMYSSILVVGGGLMFHGAQEFLLHRIINKMPPSFRRLVDNVEITTRPKASWICCTYL